MIYYTKIDQNDDFTYSIHFTNNFYAIFDRYYRGDSYFNVLYRLFGMLPQDFYHYIGSQYHASFRPSPYTKTVIYTFFKNKDNAMEFAEEIDRRITYCINRGDFK